MLYFTLADLTRLDELSIEDLARLKNSVIQMYDSCLAKGHLGAANAMFIIRSLISDEIFDRQSRAAIYKK